MRVYVVYVAAVTAQSSGGLTCGQQWTPVLDGMLGAGSLFCGNGGGCIGVNPVLARGCRMLRTAVVYLW